MVIFIKCCESALVNPIKDLIHDLALFADRISEELLALLMDYQNVWIDTDLKADTAIGRQIESLLGIDMNASKLPDYKGIELKSFRSKRPSIKKNLFCKAPKPVLPQAGWVIGPPFHLSFRHAESSISLLHLSWGHPRQALPVILAL